MLGNPEYIGIDIGQYAIKIARVKKAGKSFVSNYFVYEILPEEMRGGKDKEGLKKLIAKILKTHKIIKGQPVIHVNSGDTIMRNIVLPENTSQEAVEGAIELDLGQSLPFSLDQVYFDFDETKDANGGHLAIAARRDLIDDKTALFAGKAKTLNNPQVDVDVFAYERLVESLVQAGRIYGSTIAIMDIGYTHSRISVYQDGKYVFVREPQIGGNQVSEIIRDVYDLDLESAESKKLNQNLGEEYQELVLMPYVSSLSEQMNLALDFYEASSPDAKAIEKIYITGGGAQLKGLVLALTEKVNVPLELLDLSQFIKLQSKQTDLLQDGINHGLAIALALEGK